MAKKKFNTFHDFVLKDEIVVMKTLLMLSMWAGNILLTLIVLVCYLAKIYELAIIFGVLCLFGWLKVIKFYRMGGMKALPKMSAEKYVWRKKDEEDEKEDSDEA